MNNDVKEFWENRAKLGTNSGSDDFIIKDLEKRELKAALKGRKRILEIGCGNGMTAIEIAGEHEHAAEIVALDYAENMVELARQNYANTRQSKLQGSVEFYCGSVTDSDFIQSLGTFDAVFSQRALINLGTFEEQQAAIATIASVLRDGGLYVMCENCQEGLDKINSLRETLGLESIQRPWHNRYFGEAEVRSLSDSQFTLIEEKSFASTYYFLSRVINAALAHQEGTAPSYGAPINLLAYDLPPLLDGYGQSRLWVFKKSA